MQKPKKGQTVKTTKARNGPIRAVGTAVLGVLLLVCALFVFVLAISNPANISINNNDAIMDPATATQMVAVNNTLNGTITEVQGDAILPMSASAVLNDNNIGNARHQNTATTINSFANTHVTANATMIAKTAISNNKTTTPTSELATMTNTEGEYDAILPMSAVVGLNSNNTLAPVVKEGGECRGAELATTNANEVSANLFANFA